jgi:hypothetical protein
VVHGQGTIESKEYHTICCRWERSTHYSPSDDTYLPFLSLNLHLFVKQVEALPLKQSGRCRGANSNDNKKEWASLFILVPPGISVCALHQDSSISRQILYTKYNVYPAASYK